jgi:hypothetical protein
MLENSRITQTNQEIAGSARFFRSLLARIIRDFASGKRKGALKIDEHWVF